MVGESKCKQENDRVEGLCSQGELYGTMQKFRVGVADNARFSYNWTPFL